jgi:TM2 domain-containing membrane protein YozV
MPFMPALKSGAFWHVLVKLMKKYILSPLCSAFIVPGLGQIINGDLKKGLCILSTVFVLFVAGTIKLAFTIKSLLKGPENTQLNAATMGERLQGEDFTLLWFLLIIFGAVWLYSVLDAFWTGNKMESQGEGDDL